MGGSELVNKNIKLRDKAGKQTAMTQDKNLNIPPHIQHPTVEIYIVTKILLSRELISRTLPPRLNLQSDDCLSVAD